MTCGLGLQRWTTAYSYSLESPMHEVRIPADLFDQVTVTREPDLWSDDRGFTYRVVWSEEEGKALAECVSQPEGSSSEDVWFRDTPQGA